MKNKKMDKARVGKKSLIRKVWAWNFHDEISKLDQCLKFHSIVSIDVEFPGCIRSTTQCSIDKQVYEDLCFNVNKTKLIQLGLTATDDSGKIGGTWEFNFSDFDLAIDAHNPSSISFLKRNGLDFEELKKHGIPFSLFMTNFSSVVKKNEVFRWVTFHGLYDIGYLVKAMGLELPESIEEFARIVLDSVGIVRDLKHMAQFCEGLEDGKLGLERLGELLGRERFGLKHHAGSDSLLTASAHVNMVQRYGLNSEISDGHLYGLSNTLSCFYMNIMFGQNMCFVPDFDFD